jgi:S-formylglutathione hydrolase FrmB
MDVAAGDHQCGSAIIEFHQMLVSLGVPHEWQDSWPGIHDDYYWSAHIGDYLAWYSSKLAGE